MALFAPTDSRSRWPAVLLALAAPSCNSPLQPTPSQPVQGTYTLTVRTSDGCPVRRSWDFRADIEQNGRNLQIRLSEGHFKSCIFLNPVEMKAFKGQANPDGVLFFSGGGGSDQYLFVEEDAGAWSDGQAFGQFTGDRIDAAFNGVYAPWPDCGGRDSCRANDHMWTFVRRR